MKHDTSKRLFKEALRYIPGGVNSPARSWAAVGGQPFIVSHGSGSRIWDVDNNEFIDFVCSWGPLILGHAHPEVIAAISNLSQKGTSFGIPTEGESDLARTLVEAFPSMQMVRFVSSGTEATMSAVRLARAFTGKSKLIKFAGGYHGHGDALLVKAGSGAATLGIPSSAGVTLSSANDSLVANYNDLESVQALFGHHTNDIACLVVEPIAGNMGVVPPNPGFLKGLRDLTSQYGALLIFDEVITGFRVCYGGAQHIYGVIPDITCLGKIIGGGMPVGAYGSRSEIMAQVAPLGSMYQAGTLSGNPIAMGVGSVSLRLLQRPGIYSELESKAQKLALGLNQVFAEAEMPVTINRVGSMMTIFFSRNVVDDLESASTSDSVAFSRFFNGMLNRGIYLPPSPFEAWFVSLAHTDADIEVTIEAARKTLATLI